MKSFWIVLATLSPLIIICLIIVFILDRNSKRTGYRYRFFRQRGKNGKEGEEIVSYVLKNLKKNDEYIINDFLAARNKEGSYSIQVDHIYISRKGIFVIETKNYSGKIYGSLNDEKWVQVLAGGNIKNSFYNPVKQNQTHAEYIYNKLKQQYNVYNVVIFVNGDISSVNVTNGSLYDIHSFVREMKMFVAPSIIDTYSLEEVYKTIMEIQETNKISMEEHIQNIRTNHL